MREPALTAPEDLPTRPDDLGDRPDASASDERDGAWWRLALIVGAVAMGLATPALRWPTIGLLAICTVIGLHEAGHLVAARATRIGADEFWIGFGPRLWSRRWRGVRYGVRAIPVGGLVRIVGMDRAASDAEEPISYARAPWWKKVTVSAAGPFTNLTVAALTMYLALCTIGVPTASTTVGQVRPDSPAAHAGLEPGDELLTVDGHRIETWDDLGVVAAADGPVEVTVARQGAPVTVTAEPDDGILGIGPEVVAVTREPVTAIGETASFTGRALWSVSGSIVMLPAHAIPNLDRPADERAVSPVGIMQLAAQSDHLWTLALLFVAVNLFVGVLNLVPVPPLDGGHIAIATYEKVLSRIRGRQVTVPAGVVHTVAAAVIVVVLMVGANAFVADLTDPIAP